MSLLAMARAEEIGAALFVFFNPFFGEAAVANLRENFAHFLARFLGDDSRSGGIVALLGGVAHGIAHIAEAAAINQIDDVFQFVEALEISDFALIAGLDQCLETPPAQFTHHAA